MIVLDTHVWVWWVNDPRQLSKRARTLIDEAVGESAVYISSISAWEVTLLHQRKRLTLSMDVTTWIEHSENLPFVHFVPVDNLIARKSVLLRDPLHRDPADRIIIATALELGFPLITIDKKIRDYPYVQAVW